MNFFKNLFKKTKRDIPVMWFDKNSQYAHRLEKINNLAQFYGWDLLDHQENIFMASFGNGKNRINIYYSKMTIATCLNHPVQGKTQLFRKRVSLKLLGKIFDNPRIHTNKGYK